MQRAVADANFDVELSPGVHLLGPRARDENSLWKLVFADRSGRLVRKFFIVLFNGRKCLPTWPAYVSAES